MARRPIEQKKLRRLRKAINRKPLTAYVDIEDWLVTRGHAKSKREARQLMVDGKVKAESHTVGRERVAVRKPLTAIQTLRGEEAPEPELEWVPRPLLRVEFKKLLRVEA